MRSLLALLALALLTIACGGDAGKSDHEQNQVLRLNMYTEPPTLDPGRASDTTSAMILHLVFDGLVRMGEGDVPLPAAAEKIDISPDGKTYTFTLRSSQWSNGDPVVAKDFEFAWKRILNPNFPGEYAYQMYILKNARQVKEGRLPLDALGVRTTDTHTLVVELERPVPFFLDMLAIHCFLPLNHKVVGRNPNWAYEAGPDFVTNGPFLLQSWKHNNEIILVKNPTYWDSQAVKLSKITISMIEDVNTELSLFQKGALDWAGKPVSIGLPIDSMPALKRSGQLQFKRDAAVYFYELNTLTPPLHNANFRKALAYAINRKAIVDNITQGGELPATGIVPSSMKLQEEPYFQDGDQVEAKRLFDLSLKEMKLTPAQLPKIVLSYNTSEAHSKIAQAVQQQWKDALGLNVTLENADWKVYLDKLQQRDFTVARLSWKAAYNDPVNFLELMQYADNPMNRSGWHNPQYAKLIERSHFAQDPQERKELLQQAEKILVAEMPVIPVYYLSNNFLKNPRLRGVYYSPLGDADFTRAYFGEAE